MHSVPVCTCLYMCVLQRAEEVQADCICIVYLCVPVCVIEGGRRKLDPSFESTMLSNFDCEKGYMVLST